MFLSDTEKVEKVEKADRNIDLVDIHSQRRSQ